MIVCLCCCVWSMLSVGDVMVCVMFCVWVRVKIWDII